MAGDNRTIFSSVRPREDRASDFRELRRRHADRIFGVTEAAALVYGAPMGERSRAGRPIADDHFGRPRSS